MSLLSTTEIAKKYGFSCSQIRRLIRQGLIKAQKHGSFYMVDEDDLKDLKRRRKL